MEGGKGKKTFRRGAEKRPSLRTEGAGREGHHLKKGVGPKGVQGETLIGKKLSNQKDHRRFKESRF